MPGAVLGIEMLLVCTPRSLPVISRIPHSKAVFVACLRSTRIVYSMVRSILEYILMEAQNRASGSADQDGGIRAGTSAHLPRAAASSSSGRRSSGQRHRVRGRSRGLRGFAMSGAPIAQNNSVCWAPNLPREKGFPCKNCFFSFLPHFSPRFLTANQGVRSCCLATPPQCKVYSPRPDDLRSFRSA